MDDLKSIKANRLTAMTKDEYQDVQFKIGKLIEAVLELAAMMEENHTEQDIRLERMESILESIVVEEHSEVVWEEDADEDYKPDDDL